MMNSLIWLASLIFFVLIIVVLIEVLANQDIRKYESESRKEYENSLENEIKYYYEKKEKEQKKQS
jgi:hypothetical protein